MKAIVMTFGGLFAFWVLPVGESSFTDNRAWGQEALEVLGIQPGSCDIVTLNDIKPDDDIDMNSVVAIDFTPSVRIVSKTIHADKDIFICVQENTGAFVIVEQTIYAEIFENLLKWRPGQDADMRKQVEVVSCLKEVSGATVLGCIVDTPEEVFGTSFQDCIRERVAHPMEMDTVSILSSLGSAEVSAQGLDDRSMSITKTIQAEKHELFCIFDGQPQFPQNASKKVDIVKFTNIWENLQKLTGRDPVVKKEFESLTCVVSLPDAFVEFCAYEDIST